MRRIDALLRLVGLALLSAAGWAVGTVTGLAVTGAAVLAATYLPEGGS